MSAADLGAKADGHAERAQPRGERLQRGARVEMAFVGEIQSLREAPAKLRFEGRDLLAADALVVRRAVRELAELA